MHLPLFQSARGVCTLLILNTHLLFSTWGPAEGLVDRVGARAGVWSLTVFFALSGFLLSRGWAAHAWRDAPRPSLVRYARHRIVRILPAYWVALIAVLLTTAPDQSAGAMLSNATLTQVYTGNLLPGFEQTWSLCAEIAFYFVAPVIWLSVFTLSRKAALVVLAAVTGLSFVLLGLAVTIPAWESAAAFLWLPMNMSWFCLGISLAILEPAIRGRLAAGSAPARSATLWLLLSVAVFAGTALPVTGRMDLSDRTAATMIALQVLYCLSVGLFLVALLTPGSERTWWGQILGSRVLVWLGGISYGLFLWQMMMIVAARHLTGQPFFNGSYWLPGLVALLLTVVVAQLSWWLVELPTHGWMVRRDQARRARASGTEHVGTRS